MRTISPVFSALLIVSGLIIGARPALAQPQVNPNDLGIVVAPTAGSQDIPLAQLETQFPQIKHTAEVAFRTWFGGGEILSAQLDKDDVVAIFEVAGRIGKSAIEADIRPDGTVEELEIEISASAVPAEVLAALKQFAPTFEPAPQPLIEKSIRPSAAGLSEIWYEFSGANFDVEIRSDGKAVLIEPA